MRKLVPPAALLAALSLSPAAGAQQPAPPPTVPQPAAQPQPAPQAQPQPQPAPQAQPQPQPQPAPQAQPQPQPQPAPQPPPASPAQPAYPPQGAQPPPGYPPPYAPPYPLVLPRTLPFKDDAPPPPGYRLETQMSRGLVITGTAILGSAYLISAMTAGTAVSAGTSDGDDWAPLFIPLAGPFITLGIAEDVSLDKPEERFGGLILLFDGVAQVTGAVLLVAGLVSNQNVWVRGDIPKKAEAPRPEVLVGPRGGAVRVRF